MPCRSPSTRCGRPSSTRPAPGWTPPGLNGRQGGEGASVAPPPGAAPHPPQPPSTQRFLQAWGNDCVRGHADQVGRGVGREGALTALAQGGAICRRDLRAAGAHQTRPAPGEPPAGPASPRLQLQGRFKGERHGAGGRRVAEPQGDQGTSLCGVTALQCAEQMGRRSPRPLWAATALPAAQRLLPMYCPGPSSARQAGITYSVAAANSSGRAAEGGCMGCQRRPAAARLA